MNARHEEAAVSDAQGRAHRSLRAEALIGGIIVLLLVVVGIIIQQTIFHRFVQQNGGVPDGLFKTMNGSYYKLWSFTAPLWITTTLVAIVGIVWGIRLRKLQSGWFIIVGWLIYVAVVWSLFGASSGLVEVLGKGEAFILSAAGGTTSRRAIKAWPSTTLGVVGVAATTYNGAVVEFRLTNRYFRDIAKIGFHYFLTQFAEHTGHEEMFADIRQFIVDDDQTVDRANAFIGKRERPLLGKMLPPGTRPKGWQGHVVCAEIKDGACLAHIQLFVSEDYPSPTYTVRLASGPAGADRATGHLYAYFPDGPQGKFVGEAYDLRGEKSALQPQPLRPVVVPE